MIKKILFLLGFFILAPTAVLASDVIINEADVWFSNPRPLSGDRIRIYATVRNTGNDDARTFIKFSVDSKQLGTLQPATVLANTGQSTVFIDWIPEEGYYNIEVTSVNTEPSDTNLNNNIIKIGDFLVDLDTDNDGIFNREDLDDDNDGSDDGVELILGTNPLNPDTDDDGALDGLDEFPLDPNEKYDNDKDGIGNNADPDNDNDGVLNANDPAPFDPNITGAKEDKQEPEPELPPEPEPTPTPEYIPPVPETKPDPEPEENEEFLAEGGSDSDWEIEEVEYTFPDESEADYDLDVIIAKSRVSWNEWKFDALGVDSGYVYLWDFGDNKLAQTKNLTHKFSGSGEYKISLSVSDTLGGLGTAEEVVLIGFWSIGNPWIKIFLGLLGIFSIGLILYLIVNSLKSR